MLVSIREHLIEYPCKGIIMKRHGDLYNDISSLFNLHRAHNNARKGKTHYTEVRNVDKNKHTLLEKLHEDLVNQTFTTSKYKLKQIYEPKERTIYILPYYPDRIVQHAAMNLLQPIWDKTFIPDLYSAIPEKGIHKAIDRLRSFLKDADNTKYCLQFDIKSYYPSMNHETLMILIERKIKCRKTLWLLKNVIDSLDGETNIPIGNYLSQYFGNIYLSDFDHWLKEKHKIRYYLRYNDDGVILGNNKNELWNLLNEIQNYIETRLQLKLNPKTRIYPIDDVGIDFLGYKTHRTHTVLRKKTVNKFKHKIKEIKTHSNKMGNQHIVSSVMSYVGWMQHGNCYNLLNKHVLQDKQLGEIMNQCSLELGHENPLNRKYGEKT